MNTQEKSNMPKFIEEKYKKQAHYPEAVRFVEIWLLLFNPVTLKMFLDLLPTKQNQQMNTRETLSFGTL